jgi:hypothetical protein
MQAFREAAEDVMGKHHRAFLGVFKQMMVGVFGPGIEQVFSRAPPQGYNVEIGESSSQPPLRSQSVQPSSAERWEPGRPTPSTRRWRSTSSTSSTGRKRAASPATSARQYRSTDSTVEPISAHVWGNGVRFVWSSARVHLQDCPN